MDSSVKYEKFTSSQGDVEKKPKSKKASRYVITGLVFVAIALVLLAVAIGVGVGVSVSEESEANDLMINTLSTKEFDGEYRGSAGGIRFQTALNNSHTSVSITTTIGDPLVIILHSANMSMTMFKVQSTDFLVLKDYPGRPKYDGYVIPENSTELIHSMMMEQVEMSEEILQQLDNGTVNETRQSSLEKLAISQEAALIIEAAHALGEREIIGADYPAVMKFYLLALNLANIRVDLASNHTMSENPTRKRSIASEAYETVKAFVVSKACASKHTRISDRNKCSSKRTTPKDEDQCFGMCGPTCCCWRWLCRTCCIFKYCRSHDKCCVAGYTAMSCWNAVFEVLKKKIEGNFDCNELHKC